MQASGEFTAYGASHLGAVVVLVIGIVALLLARRLHDPDDRLGKALAVALLTTTLPLQALYFTPGQWNLQTSLPIQLCDLASLVAVYALWTHRRWAAALTYFWGITLTSQAILTPDLAADFPHPIYLLFWVMHIGTVLAAVHLVWGRGVQPDWRGYRVAIAVTACWAVSVISLNVVVGTNYGYLNRKPAAATVLDLLGPWPWYVAVEVVVIATVWALLTWPWVRRRT
jgi:hypothetical integral membrane protein (TIGR02206 family)